VCVCVCVTRLLTWPGLCAHTVLQLVTRTSDFLTCLTINSLFGDLSLIIYDIYVYILRTQYFNLPLIEAARKMGICATAIKKVRSLCSRSPYTMLDMI
jgi:hypothetical protein